MKDRRAEAGVAAAISAREFADRVARHVARFAFDAMLDVSDKQHSGLGGVKLLQASSDSAREVGALTSKAVILELLASGLLADLAKAARSQGAKKAGGSVQQRNGGKKAQWKVSARTILRRRRNLDASTDELIESLVQNLVIDHGDEGFYCHETGDRIAKSKRNLASEISKLKSEVLESRASAGK